MIYRSYIIEFSTGQHPWKVSKDNTVVYVCNSEDEALEFIDKSKRDLHKAETRG